MRYWKRGRGGDGGKGFRLTGDCPAPNDISSQNFKRHAGWVEVDLIKKDGWEQSSMYGQLNASTGAKWTDMECERDSSDNTRINCWSTGSGIGAKTGTGSFEFDDGTFGASCSTNIELDVDFGSVAIPGVCPDGQVMCGGTCCSAGHCCDWGDGMGCYESCP